MRRLRAFVLLGTALGTAALGNLATALAQQFPAIDPERAFATSDADLDGRLTLDEFREQARNSPRLKNLPGQVEPLFRRFDADGDGALTLGEYRKLFALRQGSMPKAGAAGAKRPSTTPVQALQNADAALTPEQVAFFESKIRPVLATKCASCHAQDAEKVRGGLLVDSRDGLLRGGDSGPAIVPGNPDESLLIQAIRYGDESLRMPPKGKLSDEVVADFERWVKQGAPDPRTEAKGTAARAVVDVETGRSFWSFQPPRKVEPPAVQDDSWPRTEIDRFVLARLEEKGLRPVGDADRSALIRRMTFDLIGLPPTPGEVRAFLADESPDAFARVVDRLLASERFGERWGRHWLDVARYAESSGKVNFAYPQAWRYRDWVIDAFNRDKPYDQFVREQIAGDLLPADDARQRAAQVIATGFLAIGSKAHNTLDRKQFLVDLADEQIDVTSQAFLGLTVACARCHDHKFDPIPQRDYYALSGIFQSTQTCYGTLPGVIQSNNPSPLIELPEEADPASALPRLTEAGRAALQKQIDEAIAAREAMSPQDRNFTTKGFLTNARISTLRYRLASYRPDGTPRAFAMGVQDRDEPVDSPLYIRGELDQPAEFVPRGFVQVISDGTPPPVSEGSGRRELADWLASRENPLTARVMVNRVWLHLFGRGLVPTPDNFGAAGQPPSQPELLDFLAVSFMDQSWSVKSLIRRIVLSRAYQLSTTVDDRNLEVDPDNALVWRMSPRRLEAEALRDAVLAVSGRLVLKPPVGTVVARTGEGFAGITRASAQDAIDPHRSVYLPVVRDQLPESLALFDFADPSLVSSERSGTTVPAQALYLMNSPWIARMAEATADRLVREVGDDSERIERAYLLTLARVPTSRERDRALAFLKDFGSGSAGDATDRGAWAAFCLALFASAEFRYLD
jgi:cytochrome c553